MSKLLINESPLTFQPSLAVAIGLNEAIVLQQIHYWLNNKNNRGYEYGGFKWVYNTYGEWKETNFPFWSENTIQRAFSSLEEAGLVVSIQPMKGKYDRTKYYRIDYLKLDTFDDPKLVSSDDPKLVCSLNESETTTENISESAKTERDAIAINLQKLQGGGLKSTDADLLNTWAEKHTSEWILKAIQTASDKGAKSAAYVDRILIGWEANGYPKTREQLIAESRSTRKATKAQIATRAPMTRLVRDI